MNRKKSDNIDKLIEAVQELSNLVDSVELLREHLAKDGPARFTAKDVAMFMSVWNVLDRVKKLREDY